MDALKHTIIATTVLLLMTVAASGADHSGNRVVADARGGVVKCTVEVLRSEALPGAPINQNLIRTTLQISTPDIPPFETTVVKLIPWQAPPPRQGQRLTVACDPANFVSHFSFRMFQ